MNRSLDIVFTFVLALFTTVIYASAASYCDASSSKVCYSWAVPSSSSSLYVRLEAPTFYQWVALGTGSRMSGSTMLVIYQDGSGKVTLSTRKGHGQDMPTYQAMSGIKLVEGSGVSNGTMKKGSSMDTSDASSDFAEHDGTDSFSVDLSKATVGGTSNPFLNSSNTTPSDNAVSSGGGGENHTGSAHGVIMAVVFLVGFPIGSVLMPLLGKWLIHASWQIIAFVGMWIGFGIGKIAADRDGDWFHEPHVILGTIVCVLMIVQPVLGWVHHRNYVKYQRRTTISYGHIWYGRGIMIVGIINGGIGLQLSSTSTGLIVGYSIVGILVSAIYAAGAARKMVQMKRKEHELLSDPSNSALELRA
ncbi:cellobiose dehydrogenase [Fusarium denticulatum]|uniref:Cellobiose dehydrogenase n=1 Tax=Fusarium denticulatum TaxID=48507 RepID=A0A8H5WRH9_9HYPO|nr:cellobiose dehydrogenase [Fusarium denticulatum]